MPQSLLERTQDLVMAQIQAKALAARSVTDVQRKIVQATRPWEKACRFVKAQERYT